MVLDLSGVQSFVEDDLMNDTCLISRDEAGTNDSVWFPETGEYHGPPDAIIYEGKCWISYGGTMPAKSNDGDIEQFEEGYFLNIPLGAAEIDDGDYIIVKTSLRNQHLVNKTFRANTTGMGTFKVKQKVRMVRYVRQGLR